MAVADETRKADTGARAAPGSFYFLYRHYFGSEPVFSLPVLLDFVHRTLRRKHHLGGLIARGARRSSSRDAHPAMNSLSASVYHASTFKTQLNYCLLDSNSLSRCLIVLSSVSLSIIAYVPAFLRPSSTRHCFAVPNLGRVKYTT